jgi:hypothetical protein
VSPSLARRSARSVSITTTTTFGPAGRRPAGGSSTGAPHTAEPSASGRPLRRAAAASTSVPPSGTSTARSTRRQPSGSSPRTSSSSHGRRSPSTSIQAWKRATTPGRRKARQKAEAGFEEGRPARLGRQRHREPLDTGQRGDGDPAEAGHPPAAAAAGDVRHAHPAPLGRQTEGDDRAGPVGLAPQVDLVDVLLAVRHHRKGQRAEGLDAPLALEAPGELDQLGVARGAEGQAHHVRGRQRHRQRHRLGADVEAAGHRHRLDDRSAGQVDDAQRLLPARPALASGEAEAGGERAADGVWEAAESGHDRYGGSKAGGGREYQVATGGGEGGRRDRGSSRRISVSGTRGSPRWA